MSLLNTKYFDDYVNSHRLMIRFVKQNASVPPPIQIHAHQALIRLRAYLDKQGFRMPQAQYCYNHHDERTWKFIPCDANQQSIRSSFRNPNFMYK